MKHVIITGGTGGIGSHIVKALIRDGYYLSIVGRSKSNFNRLIKNIKNKQNIQFCKADISNSQEVVNLFATLKQSEHPLYGIINAAGVQAPIGKFSENKMSEWLDNISINLLGTVNMIHGFMNVKIKGKQYRKIINFSGGGGTSSRPNFSAYAIAKTAVIRMTEILAEELIGNNIDVNAVAPGAINTNMLKEIIDAGPQAGDEYKIAFKRKNNRGGPINKIVDLCRFLISSESNGISGKLISAIWDDYKGSDFIERLRVDSDFCTLRRIDSINYDRKE